MEKHRIKCNCNCHNENYRKNVGIEEHSDCSLCFQELFIEAQEINQYMKEEKENEK